MKLRLLINPVLAAVLLCAGSALATTGTVSLAGGTNGVITMTPPTSFTNYNFNLPTTAGSTGQPLLSGGGGSTAMSWGGVSGNTGTFATTTGTLTAGHCVSIDASGNLIDSGSACSTGS